MTTKDEILQLLQAEQTAYETWVQSEDKTPPAFYREVVDALLESFQDDVPKEMYAAAELAMRLAEIVDGLESLSPPAAFWQGRELLREAVLREPPQLEPLPSLLELTTPRDKCYEGEKRGQGLTHRQAARYWRLTDERGEPMAELVQQELDKPGSVLTPEYIASVDAFRLAELGFGERPKPVRIEPPRQTYAGIEELIAQRVALPQMAKLKAEQFGVGMIDDWADALQRVARCMGIAVVESPESVLNAAGRQGIIDRVGPEAVTTALPTAAVVQPRILDTEPEAEEVGPSIEDRVMELFEGGHDVRSIAAELKISKKQAQEIIQAQQATEEEVEA